MREPPARGRGHPIAFLLLLALLWASSGVASAQDPLDGIRSRGVLVVGVKSDYPLFGQVGPAGGLEGLEADLANLLAERLGVRAQLVAVSSATRLQRLEDGSVDLLIATLGDTEQRRNIATLLEPNYYASGVNLMVPPGSAIRDWAELRGRPVCATQGAYFNRLIAERYLVDLQVFGNNRDARLAVRAGRCVGWIYDDTAIAGDLRTPEWEGWAMPLTSALVTPWAMALPRGARDSALRRAVEDAVAEWHRDGTLISLERRWGIPASDFLRRTHDLWAARDPRGDPVCRRGPNGGWPEECRNRGLLSSTDVTGLLRIGLLLKERTGVDLSVLYDRYDRTTFGFGLVRTLLLAAGSMGGALLFGVAAALLVERRLPVLTGTVRGAMTILRMTPPLLQIYVVVFGLGLWLATDWGIVVDPTLAVILCLSAYAGAAVGASLVEAASVLAATQRGFRLGASTLGRAMRTARGGVIGILVNIVKATGMASVVAVPEVISASTAIMAERGNLTVMMNVLLVTYFVIVLGTVRMLQALAGRLDRNPGASHRDAV